MLWKNWIEDFPDLSKSWESICFQQLCSFLWAAKTNDVLAVSQERTQLSSTFSILFSQEFGVRQLILPEMVSHFCCLPVATGLDPLSSTKFSLCSCLTLDQDNHKVLPNHHLSSYIRFPCNCFHLMNCQCRESFHWEWVVFLARIFVANLQYL